MERIIFHIDVNSAFLSWEACYRIHHLGGTLDLRTIPSAVGGDQSKRHGIIITKSIPAKKYHIKTGEAIVDARRKCPELVIVPPNYTLYSHASRAMIELLEEYTDTIEKYSIDEAFLDMTGTPWLQNRALLLREKEKLLLLHPAILHQGRPRPMPLPTIPYSALHPLHPTGSGRQAPQTRSKTASLPSMRFVCRRRSMPPGRARSSTGRYCWPGS